MRLIDADDLLRDNTWTWFDEWGNFTAVGEIINNAPTIDAEPVVRCKDCIHAEKMKPRLAGKVVVFCYLHMGERFVLADGYCESGERRDP